MRFLSALVLVSSFALAQVPPNTPSQSQPASAPTSQPSSEPTSVPANLPVLSPSSFLSSVTPAPEPIGEVRFGGKDRYRGFGAIVATGFVKPISTQLNSLATPVIALKGSTISHRRFLETATSVGVYKLFDETQANLFGIDLDIGVNLRSIPRNDQAIYSLINPAVGGGFSVGLLPIPTFYVSNLFLLDCRTGVRVAVRISSLGGPKTISVEPLYLKRRNVCQEKVK